MIDIEDLNRKLDAVLATEFVKPNEDDIQKYKPMLYDIINNPPKNMRETRALFRKYKMQQKNSFIMQIYYALMDRGEITNEWESLFQEVLSIKKVRSWSGVLVITIFTSPTPEYIDQNGELKKQTFSCSWSCSYCPNEPGQPRSYLKGEPGVMRANRHKFDCVEQMWARMEGLCHTGHPIDKLEVLVLGGTWCSYPLEYREQFCRDIYYAANTFWDKQKRERKSLQEEKEINWDSRCRVIGLTLETRPDTITVDEIRRFRSYGCTRVQLGVQHTDNDILNKIKRRCTTQTVKKAIRLLKDCGYKIDIHIMPNLPGSNYKKDRHMLMDEFLGMKSFIKRKNDNKKGYVYEDYELAEPDLQADQWKIYPCAITPWTEIEEWYNEGSYKPYTEEELRELLLETKALVFPWIRLNRIIRDIPSTYIIESSDQTNMRQHLAIELEKDGFKCRCIRCREVKSEKWDGENYNIVIRTYNASEGREYFISAESKDNKDTLYGFVRLRIKHNLTDNIKITFPELDNAAYIRELHVYGLLQKVKTNTQNVATNMNKENKNNTAQHKGIGKQLIKIAEEIAITNGYKKLSVISGEGTCRYYEKIGFKNSGYYMIKELVD